MANRRCVRLGIGLCKALLVLLLCHGGLAHAGEWKLAATLGSSLFLTQLSAPTAQQVFVSGFELDTSSMIPRMSCRLFASQDAGKTFVRADGGFASLSMCEPHAMTFFDAQHGWQAIDKAIYRTSDGGASWTRSAVDFVARDFHFFDARMGFAIGDAGCIRFSSDGGASWFGMPSPLAELDFVSQTWTDKSTGYLLGTEFREDSGVAWPVRCVVVVTRDGGGAWEVLAQVPSLACEQLVFVNDELAFLSAWERYDAERSIAHLLRSSDGGKSFVDAQLPTLVGTATMMGMSMPIHSSRLATMYWSDGLHAHLAGTAYVANSSSSSGGSSKIYRNVDYLSADGGASWVKTELGSVDLMSGSSASDGFVFDGLSHGLHQAWMVGEGGKVWRYEHRCASGGECPSGWTCLESNCEAPPDVCTPACALGWHCVDHVCSPVPEQEPELAPETSEAESDDALLEASPELSEEASDDQSAVDEAAKQGGSEGCGCTLQAGSSHAAMGLLALFVLVALGHARRKRSR